MKVPFLDLEAQYRSIQQDLDSAIQKTIGSFQFVGGDGITSFEKLFADKLGIRHCVATGNGTDSLFILLKCLGIGPGDEVITPAFSCIPSSEVITLCGARPVFVDVDPDYYVMDPAQLPASINSKTKAVLLVHLFGQAAPAAEIRKICDEFHLPLIEDCAQAHFTKELDRYVGTLGTASAFSFYPTKNLGAYGDAGCMVTNDAVLAERLRRFANHGALQKDDHAFEGTNSRMDSIQAAVLTAKLKHIDRWNQLRDRNARLYFDLLKEVEEIELPIARANSAHTFHVFAVRAQRRNELRQWLEHQDVHTLVHYPLALHNLPAYRYLNYPADSFPVANTLQDSLLSLPVYPELSEAQIHYVSDCIKEFYSR